MFHYEGEKLLCEQVDLDAVARAAGTPCYVYSAQSILDAYRAYDAAFDDLTQFMAGEIEEANERGA